jgi:D-lactate dehydrogenase (cytochrome)
VGACSFAFDDFDALRTTLDAVAARQLASEILGLDPEILKGFMGALTPKRFAATARAILSTTPNPAAGAAALVRAAVGLRRYLGARHWMAHFTVEGWSGAEVNARVATIRGLARRGSELANAAPLALRGNPFLPLTPVLAPDGCRWLPTHGIFSFADVGAFHAAFDAWRAARAAEFDRHRLRMTRMILPLGSTATVYEPTFYWPDSRHAAHERLAPAEHLAKVPSLPADEGARAAVFRLRRELTDLMERHGAQHLQLGKWYPYASRQDAGARALLLDLKRALDPDGLLNPGALELDGG